MLFSGMETLMKTKVNNWPSVEESTVFDYCFTVWPDDESPRMRSNRAVFDLFGMLRSRVVMEFTEKSFGDFREEIAKVGMTLREIERQPHLDPMPVN
jgi:hypothetical protein